MTTPTGKKLLDTEALEKTFNLPASPEPIYQDLTEQDEFRMSELRLNKFNVADILKSNNDQ